MPEDRECPAGAEAGAACFAPIVLTAVATFAGLTPLLLETSPCRMPEDFQRWCQLDLQETSGLAR
ncbi:MAG: hypothetical protein CL908_25740 [Deltaproteobacteria bacterium]|nr:hypothetical protein [Deltaproteobacteria bacterium]